MKAWRFPMAAGWVGRNTGPEGDRSFGQPRCRSMVRAGASEPSRSWRMRQARPSAASWTAIKPSFRCPARRIGPLAVSGIPGRICSFRLLPAASATSATLSVNPRIASPAARGWARGPPLPAKLLPRDRNSP